MIFGLCMQSLLGFVLSGAYTPLTRPENIAVSLDVRRAENGETRRKSTFISDLIAVHSAFLQSQGFTILYGVFLCEFELKIKLLLAFIGSSNASADSSFVPLSSQPSESSDLGTLLVS